MPPDVEHAELRVRRAPDGTEQTTVGVDRRARHVWLDRDRASRDPAASGGRYLAPLRDAAAPLELRVVVDRSILEVFVGDETTLTARIYPTRDDSTGIEAVGVSPEDLQVFALGSVWATGADGPVTTR